MSEVSRDNAVDETANASGEHEPHREKAPSAEEIEHRLRSWPVLTLRPAVWAALGVLSIVRRFHWSAHFESDLMRFDGPGGGPLIFAANHRSHADTSAILDTMPPRICKKTVVAAALDVFGPDTRNGWKRRMQKNALQLVTAAGFHAFAFDRHGPPLRSVRTSTQLIKSGWHLLLYPEGTRSRTGELGPFKPGVGVLARFTGRPVVPVHVDGGEVMLPYGRFMPGPGHVRVRYGEPMIFQKGDCPVEFSARVRDNVKALGERQAQADAKARAGSGGITIDVSSTPTMARKQPA